jgi:ASC-1-like (ASCH) protein
MEYRLQYLHLKSHYLKLKMQLGGQLKTITVSQPWFNLIKEGKKIVEGRLNKSVFAHLKVHDIVIWMNKESKCKSKIIYINEYKSFKEMLEREGLTNVLPGITNIDEGIMIYRQYYSEHDEKQYGVLAIGIKIIDL